MARIKFLADTFLKQSTEQATQLSDDQKQLISRGTLLVLESFENEVDHHIKITLKDDVFKGLKTGFVFADHVSIFEREPTVKLTNGASAEEQPLSQNVSLNVKHLNQLNNQFAPTGTCNVTCCAMVLNFYGIPQRKPEMEFEDELFLFMESKGWDRHLHEHLVRLLREYGLDDTFTTQATWKELKHHLANGNPIICPGDFTREGHIIVLSGYDFTGFIVQDPNGEIFWSPGSSPSYEHNTPENPHRGANLHYSYSLMDALAGPNGKVWSHFPKKK